MRSFLIALFLILAGPVMADEISDEIRAGRAVPYAVYPCSENSTQLEGACAFYKRSDSPAIYTAFWVNKQIQWIRRMMPGEESEKIYSAGFDI